MKSRGEQEAGASTFYLRRPCQSTSVRDLGIYIDADPNMRTHVQRTVSWCFAVLRQLRQIRRHIPSTTFQTLVVALVLSRLDYGNRALLYLPAYTVRRLQSVLNASARMIFQLRCSDHITDALASLHWLCVPERIQLRSLCWRIKFFIFIVRLSFLARLKGQFLYVE